MTEPLFEVLQENIFTLRMDITGLSALERGMAFFSERAILPDGDPARDLSRTLTSMLMKLAVTRNTVEAPDAVILPLAKEDVAEVEGPEGAPQTRGQASLEPVMLTEESAATIAESYAKPKIEIKPLTDVEGSQTVVVEDDDPLAKQLDEMIGD